MKNQDDENKLVILNKLAGTYLSRLRNKDESV